jgi:hypothetical protein
MHHFPGDENLHTHHPTGDHLGHDEEPELTVNIRQHISRYQWLIFHGWAQNALISPFMLPRRCAKKKQRLFPDNKQAPVSPPWR